MNEERSYAPPAGSIPTLAVPNLEGVRRVHLIGIGGAGMNGIARLLLARGIHVTGSDLKESRGLEDLRREGAGVRVGHSAENLPGTEEAPDVVVVSTAIPEGNPELVAARERGIGVLARAQMLAALAAGKRTLAVAGTHGKTTTTSMLSVLLDRLDMDPTFVIGGDLNESGSGARHGGSDLFVAEADESDGSFLLLRPEVGVITNVEEDHLDFYRGGIREIEAAFTTFANGSRTVVACGDDAGVREVLNLADANAVTYGLGEDNRAVVAVAAEEPSGIVGRLSTEGATHELRLAVHGVHNLLNAAAAVLAASAVGVNPAAATEAVGAFSGVRRRFERRGVARGAEFFDDYAHHPTEIAATLRAARSRDGGRRVVAVFQPHRYTRTGALWRQLGESLAGADVVVVTDVYAAGEDPIPGVSGKLVLDALAAAAPGKRLVWLPHRADIARFLAAEVREGDLVLTLGAGDITMVAEDTLERMREGR